MQGDKGIVLKCHAGCATADIVAAMELRVSDLFDKPLEKPTRSRITATYDYTDADGTLRYQVVRKEPKTFLQRQPDPAKPGDWIWNLKGVTRILYNLPAVIQAIEAGKKVFLCEGEKDVESLRALGLTATTNAGGAAKWNKSYTDILNKTTVIILPDNDDPGRAHAALVHSQLKDSVIVQLPGLPAKGDVTDWIKAGGTREALVQLAIDTLENKQNNPPLSPPKSSEKRYYRALGHDQGNFYFMPAESKQVLVLTAASLGRKTNLYALAPINYWEIQPDYFRDKGTDYNLIANDLIQECYTRGIFKHGSRRGRGCWYDNGKIIIHCGDHLIIDGDRVEILEHNTSVVYEQGDPIKIPYKEPISELQGQRFFELCQMLSWDSEIFAQLLAGWMAIAPICGALKWRPHIWIVGPAGSGKSWVMENIIGRLGKLAIQVQSSSTEAGIRQALGQDALPVLFDEAEPEDRKAQMNIQKVLELARQASSENGAVIMKGTASGHAQQFNIRSAFCLASIGLGTRHRADISRFTVLALCRNSSTKQFDAIQRFASEVLTDEFFSGLMARSVRLALTIRKNAETFAVAIAETTRDRRLGDQIGHLLAGYWSLWSDQEILLSDAMLYIKELNLDALAPREETKDEIMLLNYLMEQRVRVDLYHAPNAERSICELVQMVAEQNNDFADLALRRYGMRVIKDEGLWISLSHDAIAQLLKDKPWSVNWGMFLKRIDGVSETLPKNIRFAGGSKHRAVCIPLSHILGVDEEVVNENLPPQEETQTQEDIPF